MRPQDYKLYCKNILLQNGINNVISFVKEYGLSYTLEYYNIKSLKALKEILEENNIILTKQDKERAIENTLLRKYGVKHILQNKEYVNKLQKTSIERYGSISYSGTKECKNRIKNTCNEKYGVNSPFQMMDFNSKVKNTCLQKYGCEHHSQSNIVKVKHKKTCVEKFGVNSYSKTKQFKSKIKDIWNNKSKELINTYIEKEKNTKLERYGDSNYNNYNKAVNTCLERYGVKAPMQHPLIKQKYNNTCLERYGVEWAFQSKQAQEHYKENSLQKYGVINPSLRPESIEKRINTNIERYGVPYYVMMEDCRLHTHNNSQPNQLFENILKDNNIAYEREFHIDKYSYDFHILNTNILIEINPFATHNSTWNPFGEHKGIDKNYHFNKSKMAEDNKYRVIHIWDWDDKDKIIQLLKMQDKVYARKCIIKEIPYKEANEFINKYHIQNNVRSKINIALYYNNEIISVMTFGKPRYNKNYEYELLRYCSNKKVVGGSKKLFTYFLNTYKPKSIISYCDNNKFDGHTYIDLEFTLKNRSITKHWYNNKLQKHITDNLLRQRGFDQLFNENYGKGTNNDELMKEHNFVEIYDAGQSTYIINNI